MSISTAPTSTLPQHDGMSAQLVTLRDKALTIVVTKHKREDIGNAIAFAKNKTALRRAVQNSIGRHPHKNAMKADLEEVLEAIEAIA